MDVTVHITDVDENAPALGTRDMEGISIYPNPVKGHLMVKTSKKALVLVHGLDGRLQFIAESNKQMDMSGLSNGIYILTLQIAGGTFVWKVREE